MKLHDITKQIRAFADELEEQNKSDAPPFQLPPPPPGMQWHRVDGWKAEDLPPGTRPHVLGEEDYPEDSERRAVGWCSCIRQKYGSTAEDFHRRTTRPLEFEHEGKSWTWHRPGNPMPCDGEAVIEIVCIGGRTTDIDGDPLHSRRAKANMWRSTIGWRYAEPLTREVELGPEDVPPCSAVKGPSDGDNEYALVSGVGKRGIILSDGRVIAFSHMRSGWLINRPCHRDADGNPTKWEPCHKNIPQNG